MSGSRVVISRQEIFVPVSNSERESIEYVTHLMSKKYDGSDGIWRPGILNNLHIEGRHIPKHEAGMLIGRLGEYSLTVYVNDYVGYRLLEFDDTVRQYGDNGYDFKVGRETMQMKTHAHRGTTGRVRVIDEDGTPLPLTAGYYFFAQRPSSGPEGIFLLGGAPRERVQAQPTVPALNGEKWYNKEVRLALMDPVAMVLDLIQRWAA